MKFKVNHFEHCYLTKHNQIMNKRFLSLPEVYGLQLTFRQKIPGFQDCHHFSHWDFQDGPLDKLSNNFIHFFGTVIKQKQHKFNLTVKFFKHHFLAWDFDL